jgi:hypothetical protein
VLTRCETRPAGEQEEEDIAEHATTFLDVLKDWKQPGSSYIKLIPRTV